MKPHYYVHGAELTTVLELSKKIVTSNSLLFFLTKKLVIILFNIIGDDMKVKVFDCDHESDLEASINDFIEDKEVIDIKFSVSSSIFAEEQIYCFSALIVYK